MKFVDSAVHVYNYYIVLMCGDHQCIVTSLIGGKVLLGEGVVSCLLRTVGPLNNKPNTHTINSHDMLPLYSVTLQWIMALIINEQVCLEYSSTILPTGKVITML